MKERDVYFVILIACSVFFCLTITAGVTSSMAQSQWPAYTQHVLDNPLIEYIQAATLPGSVMVSGCWGYPWFTVPGPYSYPTTAWSAKNYYMYYPPIGWFDEYIYPFMDIYNVADPYRDFPNLKVLINNPGTWISLPVQELLTRKDPLAYYLKGGIHFFSGAASIPYLISVNNNPSIDPRILRYLGLMGMFDYDIPQRLVTLPSLTY